MSNRPPRPATPTTTAHATTAYPGAACVDQDPATWFPSNGDYMTAQKARRVCSGCPARETCLADAMDVEHGSSWGRWGIFGGLTATERADLARRATTPVPKVREVLTEQPGRARISGYVAGTLGARRVS